MAKKKQENPVASPYPLRLEWIDPAQLDDNPANWKSHPDMQRNGLAATIDEVGWAGALLYNERTKKLIDGHARKEIFAGRGPVPVLIGSWTEEQEKIILATLDPLGHMAVTDTPALDRLLSDIKSADGPLADLLGSLRAPVPAPYEPNLTPATAAEPVTQEDLQEAGEALIDKYKDNKHLVAVMCPQCAHTFFIDPNAKFTEPSDSPPAG